ncbi:hypothetical protein J2861_003294 [Agrobacterium tumefaciens]|nr:hypothetical protein [Agrobacterium tumefaciens]
MVFKERLKPELPILVQRFDLATYMEFYVLKRGNPLNQVTRHCFDEVTPDEQTETFSLFGDMPKRTTIKL